MASQTTAGSGDRSPRRPSSGRPSPRTGRRAASGSSDTGSAQRPAARLIAFDRAFGSQLVAGADEAGRGCLAGPLVAAAVVFDHSRLSLADFRLLSDLNDSKKVKPGAREDLLAAIQSVAAGIAVAIRPAAVIDSVGLHRTNLEALGSALGAVCGPKTVALSDGFAVQIGGRMSEKLIRGDSRSACVAAASIVAKVVRDRYMQQAALLYPGYGFENHVGYATAEHRDGLASLGLSPLHRRSFKSSAYEAAA